MEQLMSLLKVHPRNSRIPTRRHLPSILMLLRVDLQRESKKQVVFVYTSYHSFSGAHAAHAVLMLSYGAGDVSRREKVRTCIYLTNEFIQSVLEFITVIISY